MIVFDKRVKYVKKVKNRCPRLILPRKQNRTDLKVLSTGKQGCCGARTRGNGVLTAFSCFAWAWAWSCFKMASILGAFPHLFVRTTSLQKSMFGRMCKFTYASTFKF